MWEQYGVQGSLVGRDEMTEIILMTLDVHQRKVSDELNIVHMAVTEEEIEDQLETLKPSTGDKFEKKSIVGWLSSYLREHKPESLKLESKVLSKRFSSK